MLHQVFSIYSLEVSSLPLVRCCAPLADAALTDEQSLELEQVFKALADRHRVRILNTLIAAGEEAVCVCDFTDALPLKQSTVSYHLKQLVDVGLIERERRGTYAYYRIVPGALNRISGVLTSPVPLPAGA